jgi:hypothetical protein
MVIIGNIDLLGEAVINDLIAAESVRTIMDATLRGAELTRRLLAFSRSSCCVLIIGLYLASKSSC